MSELEHFEIGEAYGAFRPTGQVSLEQTIRLVTSAITFAREHHVRKLLVDITGLTGFEPPSLARRYVLIQEWAHAANGRVRLAMVTAPEMIDPQKFGVLVAANNGLIGDVFTSEEEALTWLQSIK